MTEVPFSFWFVLEDLLQNRGKVVAALGGVVLAVSLVTLANLAFDRGNSRVLWAALDDTPIDLMVWLRDGGTLEEVSAVKTELQSRAEVSSATTLAVLRPKRFSVRFGNESIRYLLAVFGVDEGFATVSSDLGIILNESEILPKKGEVYFSNSELSYMTQLLGREPVPGEMVDLGHGWNFTYTHSFETDYSVYWQTMGSVQQPSAIVEMGACLDMIRELGEDHANIEIRYEGKKSIVIPDTTIILVEVHRSSYAGIAYHEEYDEALDKLVDRVEDETGLRLGYASPVDNAVQNYSSELESSRMLFLLSSLPAVLLGAYIGVIGIDIRQSSREHKISLLTLRGVNRKQARRIVLVESLVLGIIGGSIGVLAGSLIGQVTEISTQGILPGTSSRTVFPSLLSITAGIGIAVVMTAASSLRTTRRHWKQVGRAPMAKDPRNRGGMGNTGSNEGRGSGDDSKDSYRPRLDLCLVLLPLATYALILTNTRPTGMSLVGLLLGVLYPLGVAMIPLTPFMVTWGLSRLLTLSSSKPYHYLAKAMAPIAGSLGSFVEDRLAHGSRRLAKLAILLALSVAFSTSILSLTSSYTQRYTMEDVFRTGSDITVRLYRLPEADRGEVLSQIPRLEGVEEVTVVDTHYIGEGILRMTIISVDPETLKTCLQNNPYFDKKARKALDLLQGGERIALAQGTQRFAVSLGEIRLEPTIDEDQGSEQESGQDHPDRSISLEIVGGFSNLPGTNTLDQGGVETPTILTTHDAVRDVLAPDRPRCLVKLLDPSQAGDVAEEIRSLHHLLSETPDVFFAGRYEDIVSRTMPGISDLVSYMRFESGLIVVMAALGLGLASYSSLQSEVSEIAGSMARGMSRRQLVTVLLAQGLVVSLLGIGVGFLAGVFPPYLYGASASRMMGSTLLPPFAIPRGVPTILIAYLSAMILTSVLTAYAGSRIRLDKVLRVRR